MKRKASASKPGRRDDFAVPTLQRGDDRMIRVLNARRQELDADRLADLLAPRVEGLLRAVGEWGPKVGEDWDIGDYRFLILDFRSGDATLYVQFWSEPHEPIHTEVSSGIANPPAHLLVGAVQRKKLRALGYRIGGKARNYEKDVHLGGDGLRSLALEAVHILVHVLGYRGLSALRAQLHADTRGQTAIVHDAVTPEEVSKMLMALHLDVSDNLGTRSAPHLTARAHTGDEVSVRLASKVAGQNLFRHVVLFRQHAGSTAFATLDVEGGVTTAYIYLQLARHVAALLADDVDPPDTDEATVH